MNMINAMLLSYNAAYVPWDATLFYTALRGLRSNIGVIINIGLWGFVVITGVYLIIKIVGSLVG